MRELKSGKALKGSSRTSARTFSCEERGEENGGCLVLMILSEKSSKKKAHEEVMLLYSKRKPPKFHRIERALHFLRMSDEDLHKLARKISKTVHKLWFWKVCCGRRDDNTRLVSEFEIGNSKKEKEGRRA